MGLLGWWVGLVLVYRDVCLLGNLVSFVVGYGLWVALVWVWGKACYGIALTCVG